MKLAVFGGSGVVGRALLPALLDRGCEIRAMQHAACVQTQGIEVVEGSITDPAAVAETVGGAEVVLQMTKGGAGIDQVVETSVRGTINVLDAIVSAGGVRQYVLTSSDAAAGIWSHPHPGPISHLTPPMSYGGYYSLGKVLEEVIVGEYHRNADVPYTIARLSFVMREDLLLRLLVAGYDPARPERGPFDSHYSPEQKRRLADGQRFVVLPCDAARRPLGRTLVQREDVVDALAAMLGSPAAMEKTLHVSGPGFSYQQPCEYLAGKLDLPVERVIVPDAYSFDIDFSLTTELVGWSARFDVIAMVDAALAFRSPGGAEPGRP